jgi:hypothetical protein
VRRHRIFGSADWPIGRNPFPARMRMQGGQVDQPRARLDAGGLYGGNLLLAEGSTDDTKTARKRSVGAIVLFEGERTVAVRVFSGLVSSACARASAAAILPMRSLERCIRPLHLKRTEADRA